MKKGSRILAIILGLTMLVVGVYEVYTGLFGDNGIFSNKPKDNDSTQAVMIGETAHNKEGVEFCVTSVDNEKSIGSDYSKLETNNNFVVLTIKVTNNSNDPYDINSSRFMLTDGNNEYKYEASALLSVENHMYLDTLNPNISKEYVIVYETPTETVEKEYKLKIKPVDLSDIDSVYITLK